MDDEGIGAITLGADITVNQTIRISRSVTIEGNGKKISRTYNTDSTGPVVEVGTGVSNVTINNLGVILLKGTFTGIPGYNSLPAIRLSGSNTNLVITNNVLTNGPIGGTYTNGADISDNKITGTGDEGIWFYSQLNEGEAGELAKELFNGNDITNYGEGSSAVKVQYDDGWVNFSGTE